MGFDVRSAWPFLVTALFIALLGYFTWKQPNRPGKRYFALLIGLWLAWALAASLEAALPAGQERFLPVVTEVFCAVLIAPVELFFALEYTGGLRWLTPARAALIILPALVFALLAATNPLHNLAWDGVHYGAAIIPARGPVALGGIIYSFLVWLVNAAVLAGCLPRAPAFHRPILLMLLGQVIPRAAFLAARHELTGLSPLQLSLVASSLSALAYFAGLFNFWLLQVMPIGRDAALERIAYSVIVLDAEDRVADLNPAARRLPGMPASPVIGQPAGRALGPWWERLSPFAGPEPGLRELRVVADGDSAAPRVYEMHSLPLFHASGWRMGHVFVLADITPAWRARQLAAQQQWAQATLQEREQLAQELHDGLSQSLAFLNVQAQAAQVYLQGGQAEDARACLDRLVEVARQIQGDTRELIGNLMIVSLPQEGLIPLLRQALSRFEKQTGLRALFQVDPKAEAACRPETLDPSTIVQLLRIIQEALANVHKHAQQSSRIALRLAVEDGHLQVAVEDDGEGFDPADVAVEDGKHYGLEIMRQRAARIGAQLVIASEVGKGTRVEICVPVDKIRISV